MLGGCANIPEQTLPQPIENSLAPSKQPVSGPTKDAEPITVVRDFIRANGNPIVASAYLTDEAKKLWHPNNQPTVIDDDFSTVPEPVETQGDPNRADVNVKGLLVGVLNADKSFLAQQGNYTGVVQLAKQDGQWRISRVPNNGMVVVPKAEFLQTYRLVKLYFYDGTRTVLVPDARYLPANPRPVPTDIVDLLLHGPATSLQNAMHSILPDSATQRTNAVVAKDSNVLVVNLGDLGNPTAEDRDLIAQQVVLSLQDVASTVRLFAEGVPLIPDHADWKVTDLQSTSEKTTPPAQLPGYVVVQNRLKSLKDLSPFPGAPGNGEYKVQSAAQSVDGSQLAIVEQVAGGVQLRVGNAAEGLRVVYPGQGAGPATTMTRPTWQFGISTNQLSNEVWTVVDGTNVIRLQRGKENVWSPLPVDATNLSPYGTITELRLSRDGVRVAIVAGGKLYIGAVARVDNSTSIVAPKLVPYLTSVVSVDWLNQSTVMVATNSSNGPVWRVPVDGIEPDRYSVANLTPPLTAITAAPSRGVIVTDSVGMWRASAPGQVWELMPNGQGAGAWPFYPG
ncbi:LpqB family beta-propeller domain-containing protein [Kibdelosporangium lantanae]